MTQICTEGQNESSGDRAKGTSERTVNKTEEKRHKKKQRRQQWDMVEWVRFIWARAGEDKSFKIESQSLFNCDEIIALLIHWPVLLRIFYLD